ncbi:MAG: hypothetical protein B6U88_02465 [Candidatus Aenigmarchaeota archaeon ex4484_56]|nr:MAG: hypothetical protein B6U88_02465 [Candidatus Aenigmarchaeota archaeon ex4484_56]
MDTKIKLEELKSKKWIDTTMIFEVLGTNREIVEKSLKEHIKNLEKIKTCFVYKKEYSDITKVEKPLRNIDEGYSQIVEVNCMIKDLKTLTIISISYGPSSIEILEPDKIELSAGEAQDILNMVSGVVHKFAEVGLGGIVATPKN